MIYQDLYGKIISNLEIKTPLVVEINKILERAETENPEDVIEFCIQLLREKSDEISVQDKRDIYHTVSILNTRLRDFQTLEEWTKKGLKSFPRFRHLLFYHAMAAQGLEKWEIALDRWGGIA